MVNSYELAGLDPYAFENLVNLLALKVLGAGASGFGPGADGGRDGFFEGEAPYPSATDHWKGIWYIQSKFHSPHLSKDPHKWLIEKVKAEIAAFEEEESERNWPDNWIIATNIDPSGKPETGSFDAIRSLVTEATSKKVNVAVWGGNKILGLLVQNPEIAKNYAHFITPGQVLSSLQAQLTDQYASIDTVIRYLVATQFSEQIYTKLDQAGSSSDTRPGVHHLFIDIPFTVDGSKVEGSALDHLCRASAQPQRHSVVSSYPKVWRDWHKNPQRARVALLKGGPGQGKSTVGQYFSQIQRAALLLLSGAPTVIEKVKNAVHEVEVAAKRIGAWPSAPRIPIFIELKEYAHWFGQKSNTEARGVLTYLASRISVRVEQDVLPATLRRALALQSWFVLFDGLDEVPNDVKDQIADEVNAFVNDVVVQLDADVLTLCTSRPQGYSGQFSTLDGPVLNLQKLDVETAILCAEPVVRYDRSEDEGTRSLDLLKAAAASQSVQQLMTTPLQSHIMAVVVRDGGRPPERRWQLFENFYQVMKKRESLKNVHNPRISRLLREEDRLLRAVHTRLGFVLHARAERSDGAQTTLTKEEFRTLVTQVVEKLSEDDTHNTVDVVMEAMTERLVLVSTPENGAHVRFDIRQLQEFFAAEFLYDAVTPEVLANRIENVGGDSHWLEVMHFLLSALVENRRTTELDVTIKVLERLNEGNLDGTHRLFYRRMGKGAILATRLLIEGVLEQDKRDRLRFRPLFEPLGGLLDTRVLRDLANVRSLNSRTWLINLLREKISEANYSESLGAVIALGWILPDEHPTYPELLQWFLSCPTPSQQEAMSAWNTFEGIFFRPRNLEQLSFWVICAVVKIASGEQWCQLSEKGKKDIRGLLAVHQKYIARACEVVGVELKLANLISAIFDRDLDNDGDSEPYSLGPIQARIHRHNWTTGSLPPRIQVALAECLAVNASGLFQVILALLRFSQAMTFDNLQKVLKVIPNGQEYVLGALPSWMVALIPCRGPYYFTAYDCSHLRSLDIEAFSQLIGKPNVHKYPPLDRVLTIGRSGVDDSGIERLFEHLPRIGVHIFLAPGTPTFSLSETEIEQGLILTKRVMLKAPALAKMHYLSWGVFEKDQVFLKALNDLVKNDGCIGINLEYGSAQIFPFSVDIEDGFSLCLIAQGIVHRLNFPNDKEWPEIVQELSNNISLFGLTASCLSALTADVMQNITTRAASQLLGFICEDAASIKNRLTVAIQDTALIQSFINDQTESWYVAGLCNLMKRELGEHIPGAVPTAEALLAIARDRVEIRDPLSSMLAVWREASSSPVSANQSLQKWLDE